MKLPRTCRRTSGVEAGGFTLAEVLAALVFMAIVIPVALQGLRISSLAGEVALRKAVAARLADRILNEMIVTKQTTGSSLAGTLEEGPVLYQWQMRNEPWGLEALRLISIEVKFPVQGQIYDVKLSTLADATQP